MVALGKVSVSYERGTPVGFMVSPDRRGGFVAAEASPGRNGRFEPVALQGWQGYLAHNKQLPPRTLKQDSA